ANIANAYKADLFVSLHSNAIGGSGWSDNTRGLSVWTYAEGGERNRAAKLLLAEMKQAGVQTFGNELYHQKFTVLAKTNMPAYLIEYAFHTSHPDVELLLDDAHRDKLALATAKAICAFGGVKWVDVTTSPTMPSGDVLYRVQVGAFRVEGNAVQMMQELENKGYKPFVVKEVKQ
ncbi:MAG: N-acetylmuramoyl-L-alanine amidase, partial [Syntrophomonadaceae bacterium]